MVYNRVLNMPGQRSGALIMPGIRIWEGCEYVRVAEGAESA